MNKAEKPFETLRSVGLGALLLLLFSGLTPASQITEAGLQKIGERTQEEADIRFGDTLYVDLCVPTTDVNRERLNLKLVLAGVAVVDEPTDFTANGRPCSPEETGSELVRLGFRVTFQEALREKWMYVFDQRDGDGKVTVSLRTQDDERVRLKEATDAALRVTLTKRRLGAFWGGVLVFLALAGSLYWLDHHLRWNLLRDASFDRKRFLSSQLKKLERKREEAEAMRTVMVADVLGAAEDFDKSAIPNWLEYRGFDADAREGRREDLLIQLKKLASFAEPKQRIEELFSAYRGLLDWAKQLNADLKRSSGTDLDPLAQPDLFSHRLDSIDQRPKYSLGRCQMAWWTLLVVAGFVLMWISTETLFDLPESILWLMGISVTTAGAAHVIDVQKPPTTLPPVTSGKILRDVLSDPAGGTGFSRWQIVIWSTLLGGVFAYTLVDSFLFTDFEATWLGLMGISSGTYVGFKIPERPAEQTGGANE